MSPSSLESQIAEHTEHSEMNHDGQGNLALSSADFSALEDRVARAVNLVKSERQARSAAEQVTQRPINPGAGRAGVAFSGLRRQRHELRRSRHP